MNSPIKIVLLLILFWIIPFSSGCNRSDSQAAENSPETMSPRVLMNGEEITFPPGSPQLEQIHVDSVRYNNVQLSISAPAHIAVGVVRSDYDTSKLFLFETQELTELYADFLKSASTAERTSRQLDRMMDLKAHLAVAEKDVVDAQHESTEAQADLAEKESRLRAAGIDPRSLQDSPAGTVSILADIPEAQIASVQKNESAAWTCNDFPGEISTGRVIAIGDVVDPATRTFKIRIALRNDHGHLRPGMFGSIALHTAVQNALTVPVNAVIMVQGKSYVFEEMSPGKFRRKAILIKSQTPDKYVVSGGVQPGARVATDGILLLKGLSFGY